MSISQLTPHKTDLERLSDVVKLSAHVTRVLGQNPGLMTLQGTNSYLLQPPSNGHAPLILIDTSSPHTAQQYVDCLMTHLYHLGLESGNRETHFESREAEKSLERLPEEDRDIAKAKVIGLRKEDPLAQELMRTEYGPHGRWAMSAKKERKLPSIEHIILTHRHLDHTGALPLLLTTLKEKGCPPPKIWKFPSPDEATLALNEKDRATMDSALIASLPQGTYHAFSPFQPLHPIMPGLMLSIIDPVYKHLLKHDKDGKPKWNEVPEIARVSVRCLRTPGHTADSVSLVMCEGEKGVFTGDTVLGQGTTVFTDMSAYMMSLKTLLALKPSVLYPAHGPHLPNREASTKHLSDYITHRQEREDQIVDLLQRLSSDPTLIGKMYADLVEKTIADKAAEHKYNHEFLSGKPYHPPKPKPAKDAKEKKDAESKDKKDEGKEKKDEGQDGKDDAKDEKDDPNDDKEPESEEDPKEVERKKKADARAAIIAKFPKTKAVPLSIMCRFLYKSDKDNLIAAASKSIEAHLKKLESEGKVRAVKVKMPAVSEGKIGEDWAEMACWELAGDISPEEVSKDAAGEAVA